MKNESGSILGCGCWIVILILNLVLGGWSVNYLLLAFLEKSLPFFWATVIGLFVGEFSIPVAVVVKILQAFGII